MYWPYFTHLVASKVLHALHTGELWQWWGSLLRRTDGCSPRAGVSEGGKGRKRGRRTRMNFQLLFVTSRFLKLRALRIPGGSVRRQRGTVSWGTTASPHFTTASASWACPPNQALHDPPGLNTLLGEPSWWHGLQVGVLPSTAKRDSWLETQNLAQSSWQHCKTRLRPNYNNPNLPKLANTPLKSEFNKRDGPLQKWKLQIIHEGC